ncbi:MAG TPA: Gfo/Idh/MocA family oxidoreductase [Candidatus Dormibacteraeota bacterium]
MAPLRLGLAGAGRMGRNHMRGIEGSDVVRITAIAEPMETTRNTIPSTDAAVFPDLDSMIAAGGIDAALVCVPSDLHLHTVRKLVAAGLPMLCEKPLGVTPAEARAATALAAAAGLPLQIGFWRRFVPMLQHLRGRIAAGELGDLYLVACYQWDGAPPTAYFRAHSGGIFVDMGVHEFDQARWLTGQEVGGISAVASGMTDDPAGADPDSAQAIAELSGGATAIVSLGRRYPLGDVCKVEVFGTKDADEARFLWPPSADETFFAALRLQAESFARHVRGAPREGAGGDDAAAAIEASGAAAAALSKPAA